MREKIFNIIQIGDKSNRISRAFDIFITITIVSNILVTFLQTFEELDFLSGFFFVVEVITLFIFCVEYVLRHSDHCSGVLFVRICDLSDAPGGKNLSSLPPECKI